MMRKQAFKTIDEYLAGVRDKTHRAALDKLRMQIRAAAKSRRMYQLSDPYFSIFHALN